MTRVELSLRPLLGQRLLQVLTAFAIMLGSFTFGMAFVAYPAAAAILALAGLAGLACLWRSDVATYVVVAILYSNAAAVAVNFHGLPAFVGLAFPLLLAIPLVEQVLLRRQPLRFTSAFPFLFGYLLILVVSSAAAADPSSALDNLVIFLTGGFAMFLVIANVVRSLEAMRKVVWVVLAVGAVLGALSTFQAVTGTYHENFFGFAQVNLPGVGTTEVVESLTGTARHEGPIGEVNRYGQIMLVLVPIGALLALGESRRRTRAIALGLTLLVLLGMATTFSRGAALGLGSIIVAAAFLRYLRPIHIVAIVASVALVFAVVPSYAERLVDLQGLSRLDRSVGGTPPEGDVSNLRGRATQTLTALLVFADNPLVGVGPGQFGRYYADYAQQLAASGFDTRIDQGGRDPHNLYTGMLAEAGALGFACFMGVFLVTLRDLYRARRRWLRERPAVAHLASGFWLAIIGYMVSGMALHLAYERYLWLLLALAAVTAHLALKPTLAAPAPQAREGAAKGTGSPQLPSAAALS